MKKKHRFRRIISLLLGLSLFTVSGISWTLRCVGLTIGNKTACETEEHTHTDACYEKRLICGLEESAEHAHTEECFETVLICGMAEHTHDSGCFPDEDIGSLFSARQISLEDARNLAADIGVYDSDDTDFAVDEPDDAPEMLRGAADSSTVQDGGEFDDLPLAVIPTIDNIAKGIKFTLFDYGDSSLESESNSYQFLWDSAAEVWTFPKYDGEEVLTGWKDSGINTGRTPANDIMFFAYGTPVDQNCADPSRLANIVRRNENGDIIERIYVPDKNSLSGDYEVSRFYSMNRPVQGIVNGKLSVTDGYPTVKDSGASLAYLFDNSDSEYKAVYQNVNHLLKEKDGYFVYNSDLNYAYFDTDTGEFEVYNQTFHVVNDDHHRKNDVNCSTNDEYVYQDTVKDNFMIGFFPFNSYDETKKDPNYDGNTYNHHFGMKMEAKFKNTVDENGNPVTFKYSGDDDMWVFVDGVLVLDIGGIHEPAGGMIDFTNGYVWVQDNEQGHTIAELKTLNQYQEIDFDSLPQPTIYGTSDGYGEQKWLFKTIAECFSENGETWKAEDGAEHEIKMFYLERGGCYSNLAMEMNLPTVKPLDIMKKVDYQDYLVKGFYENWLYRFKIQERVLNDETGAYEWIQPAGIPYPIDIPANERRTFDILGEDRVFRVIEEGVITGYNELGAPVIIPLNNGTFSRVQVNGATTDFSGGMAVSNLNGDLLTDVNSYIFTNQITQKTTDLSVQKDWNNTINNQNNVWPEGFIMKYQIIRTDDSLPDGDPNKEKLVALQVKNEQGEPVTDEYGRPKKTRVFTLSSAHQSELHTGLLSRYGNRCYSYRIEELNVPFGYDASYQITSDSSGNLFCTVTNTDTARKDLFIQKEWQNLSANQPNVELRVTRTKRGYTGSLNTSLTVNILDETGNPITSYTTNDVYEGGSAELPYTFPTGVEIYKGDPAYPQKQIGNNAAVTANAKDNPVNGPLYVKFEEDEGILAVYNLAAGSNTVTFKVTTGSAADSLLLLHHSFTRSTNGWVTNTPSEFVTDSQGNTVTENDGITPKRKVTASSAVQYAKKDGLIVQGRMNAWNGAKLPLDPDKFKAHKTYTFSVYVWSPVEDDFKMTFNNGLGENEPLTVLNTNQKSVHVPKEEWTLMTGTIRLTDTIDPYNMYLLIETLPVGGDNNNSPIPSGGTYFRIDEFTAIEGETTVTVSPQTDTDPGGIVTIGEKSATVITVSDTPTQTVYNYTFTNPNNIENFNGLDDGWQIQDRGNAGVQTSESNDNGAIMVLNRDDTGDGISKSVANILKRGHTYRFEVGAQHEGASGADDVHLTLYVNGSGVNTGDNPNNHFPWVCTVDITPNRDDYIWGQATGDAVTIPMDADPSEMYMYFETGSNTNNATGPFRIRYVKIYDYSEETTTVITNNEAKPGYDIVEGQYVSNYRLYTIEADTNSVTNPVIFNSEPVTEDWERTITLKGDETTPWQYHFTKDLLGELPAQDGTGYLYEYHVEEIRLIDPVTGDEIPIADYCLVSYSGNDVAGNTANAPIRVTNKYIWYQMPETGGKGTGAFFSSGLFLFLTGFIGRYALKRRERRFK